MPGIDVELCPPGTMAAIANAVKAWDKWDTDLGAAPPAEWVRAMIPLEAILTAHRAQLDPGPTINQSLTVQSTCKPSLQVDYTSETEDLSTWPQTRGPEWRRMGMDEVLQIGDSWAHTDGHYLWVGKIISTLPVKAMKSKEAWTRRPAPEAQP